MGLIQKIDNALRNLEDSTPYWLEHALIGVGIQLIAWSLFNIWWSAAIGTGFYLVRELYQWFVEGKTHNGKFDHAGWISPLVATFLLALIITIT
jgi:hypothetical protein